MTQYPDPDIDSAPAAGSNLPEYTVSELSTALKRTVEDAYGFVRLRGEVSQPKRVSSGHLYLRLKDDKAVIDGVCWRGTVDRLGIRPEDGMEVVVTGRLTTYAARSQYQIVIESMALAGEGALLKLLEERRRRLAAEGLFDAERKRPLPYLPDVIGVVTSPTGAVIRDILHRLADRFPRHVLLWPVAVQGDGAAGQIAEAIAGFNALPSGGPVPRPDVLIVARGGGSLEDLMPFNEEAVVRAVAAGTIPLISAVGHETDTTLIDHAADRRAPTPTAAAEMAVPVKAELAATLLDLERRRLTALVRSVAERRHRVEGLGRGLGDPARLLEAAFQRLDDRAERLARAPQTLVDRARARLAQLAAALRHPRQTLADNRRRLGAAGERLSAAGTLHIVRQRQRYQGVAARLTVQPLVRAGTERRSRLADLDHRLPIATRRIAAAMADRLTGLARLLETVSVDQVLKRGFVLVRDRDGRVVLDPSPLKPGAPLTLGFHGGRSVPVKVADRDGGPPPRPPRKPEPGQGSLF